jgi:peptide/nickel transport system substrate-binding protein
MKKIVFISVAIWSILIGSLTTVTGLAASSSSVVVGLTGAVSSLNPFTNDAFTSYNKEIWNLTSAHFHYMGEQGNDLPTQLGRLEVVTNTPNLFQVKQTINPGNVWSDGTPIDAVDLLLKFVISSSAYSTQAGLGNPAQTSPAFNSVWYGSSFDTKVIGEPTISTDRMSLTYSFSSYFSDWQSHLVLAQPAHALEMISYPELTPAIAKNQFLTDFMNKDTARLTRLAAVWSTSYLTQNLSPSSNPSLFISSGQFQIASSSIASSTLVANQVGAFIAMPKSPIRTVSIRSIPNQTQATQAMSNGDIDILDGLFGSGGFTACLAMSGVNCTAYHTNIHSSVNLRVAASYGSGGAPYAGPFAGASVQARDLRKAFLLSIPTESIDESVCKMHPSLPASFNPSVRISSLSRMPKSAAFTQGFSDGVYKSKTLTERLVLAKEIVRQYYPSWDGTRANAPVNISMSFAITSVQRVSTFNTIRSAVADSGFNLSATTDANFFGGSINSSQYDSQMYALGFLGTSIESDIQVSKNIYGTAGGNNTSGWSNAAIDNSIESLLNRPLTSADDSAIAALATAIQSQYWTLPICQNSASLASVSNLYLNRDQGLSMQTGDGLFGRHFGWSFDAPLAVAPVSTPSPTPTPVVSASSSPTSAPVVSSSPSVSSAPVVSASPSVSSAPVVSASPSVSSAPVVSASPSVSSAPVVSPAPTATAFPSASATPTLSSSPKPSSTSSAVIKTLSVPSSAITLPAGSTFITKSVTAKLQGYAKSIVAGKYSQIVIPVKTQGTTLTKAVNQAKAMAKVLVKAKVKANVTVTYSGNKASVRITARR